MPAQRIQVGVFGRAHGVRGWLRITSHTADPADLTAYGPLRDEQGRQFVLGWKAPGVAEVSEVIDGTPIKLADRSAAERLTNTRLFIDRAVLPPPDDADEFYLADLIGLPAVDAAGMPVGRIRTVHDYGAGASLEIERPAAPALVVPFTRTCVPTVDLQAGRIVVVPPDDVTAEDAAA